MAISVEIDPYSGFCAGVVRAISRAEACAEQYGTIYSLGEIVHNGIELSRLRERGLKVVSLSDLDNLSAGDHVLIRAHGVPPQTYKLLFEKGLILEDCTCGVVLRLQNEIRSCHESGSTVVIFGKIGHPEVLGLVGQTGGKAIVIESISEAEKLQLQGQTDLFSQTTGDPEEYAVIAQVLSEHCPQLTVHQSICAQVAARHKRLFDFAARHDVVIFVSGKASSNGKVLYSLCKEVNSRTYRIEDAYEIRKDWFLDGDKVGICGATSTPKWQLEEVQKAIADILI